MANEYTVNQADLTAVANAIRAKGGTSEALAFPAGFVEAVAAITSGTGVNGNANTYSGDYVLDSLASIGKDGYTLNLGLPSRVKYFFMWFDREDFMKLEQVSNNHIGMLLILPVTVSTILPIKTNASSIAPDTADRFFICGTNYGTTTGSPNGYGSSGLSSHVAQNLSNWTCNDDGTITICRFSTAGAYLFAGTYHWIAVC